MKSELLTTQGEKTYAVIFDKGDEVIAGLQAFADTHDVATYEIVGIGAFRDVTLGYFDRERKDYKKIPLDEQVEALSLVGNISRSGDMPKVHVHVVVGKADGTAWGGHILAAHVWPTLELIVTEAPAHLRRSTDPETGLALIDLHASRAASPTGGTDNEKEHRTMYAVKVERAIERLPGVAENGAKISHAIHNAVLRSGDQARKAVDTLHGTWLGHPLHPVLTDIPIGAWTVALMCDLVAAQRGSAEAETMADALVAIGAIAAVPTAIAGVADYSAIDESAVAMATVHGLLNSAGLVLNLLSIRDRAAGNRSRGVLLSTVAFGALNLSAWIGGEMVYHRKIGVNHAAESAEPAEWQAVMESAALPEHAPKRVSVAGVPVLLYRDRARVYAIGAVCSHAGGPLDEGNFFGHCVECPWHDSVFDLRDGSVVHGPATYSEAAYDVRLRDGQIEVRRRAAEAGG